MFTNVDIIRDIDKFTKGSLRYFSFDNDKVLTSQYARQSNHILPLSSHVMGSPTTCVFSYLCIDLDNGNVFIEYNPSREGLLLTNIIDDLKENLLLNTNVDTLTSFFEMFCMGESNWEQSCTWFKSKCVRLIPKKDETNFSTHIGYFLAMSLLNRDLDNVDLRNYFSFLFKMSYIARKLLNLDDTNLFNGLNNKVPYFVYYLSARGKESILHITESNSRAYLGIAKSLHFDLFNNKDALIKELRKLNGIECMQVKDSLDNILCDFRCLNNI